MITKWQLAQQIAHAEQNFKPFGEMSVSELRDGYRRQCELAARYKKRELFELREKIYRKLCATK